jgi:hypothetical protein
MGTPMRTQPLKQSMYDGASSGAEVCCWNAGPVRRASPQNRVSRAGGVCWSRPAGPSGATLERTAPEESERRSSDEVESEEAMREKGTVELEEVLRVKYSLEAPVSRTGEAWCTSVA